MSEFKIDPFDFLPSVDDVWEDSDVTRQKIKMLLGELQDAYNQNDVSHLHEIEHMMIKDLLEDSNHMKCPSCYRFVDKLLRRIHEGAQ